MCLTQGFTLLPFKSILYSLQSSFQVHLYVRNRHIPIKIIIIIVQKKILIAPVRSNNT